MRKTTLTDEELGKLGWDTYNKAIGGKAFNGDPLPTWEEMKKAAVDDSKRAGIVTAWKRVGRMIANAVEKNLPDPPTVAAKVAQLGVICSPSLDDPSKIAPFPSSDPLPTTRSLAKRTKCCGSHSVSLRVGGSYFCPCGDTSYKPDEVPS